MKKYIRPALLVTFISTLALEFAMLFGVTIPGSSMLVLYLVPLNALLALILSRQNTQDPSTAGAYDKALLTAVGLFFAINVIGLFVVSYLLSSAISKMTL